MTLIKQALAKVRELREAERKMTEGVWRSGRGNVGARHLQFLFIPGNDGIRLGSTEESNADAIGIVALRNAAPALLDLLEVFLLREQAGAALVDSALAQGGDFDVEAEAAFDATVTPVISALAAFVETGK